MNEQWKPIAGYEGRYEVSDFGNVRSLITNRVLRPGPTSKGYLSVNLYDGSTPKAPVSRTVHSLVAEAFIGPCPEGMEVNHKDTSKQNNRADNLEYVTRLGNIQHAIANGRSPKRYLGSAHVNAKLTDVQVAELRRIAMQRTVDGRIPRVLSNLALSRLMGVSEMTIAHAMDGTSYKNATA